MRKVAMSGLLTSILLAATVSAATTASADPALGGDAYAFGATVTLTDQDLLPPTPEAEASAPAFPADDENTLLPIPADPLAVNATLSASAQVHQNADLDSALEVEEQDVAGPYNAKAVGTAEDVEVLVDAVATDVPLVEADLLRGEVVAKCVGNDTQYSANSDIVNLSVAGDEALTGALNDIIDQLFPGLDPLDPIINLEDNVVTELPNGLAVDALVVTVLEAADAEVGLAQVRIGHAELSDVACGTAAAVPQCSDTADNDGDGKVDAADPGCHTDGNADNPDSYDPTDNDETDGGGPQCSDGVDNDGDSTIDADDPGCHSDGDATNPDSYDPNDDDERTQCSDEVDNDGGGDIDLADPGCTDVQDETESPNPAGAGALPRTGGAVPTAAATGLGLAALGLFALRRRIVA